MHDERSCSELREIKTIHERYLRDYSAYLQRYIDAAQCTPRQHAGVRARRSCCMSNWPRMAAVLVRSSQQER
jgi:hypothetical protein